MSLTEARGVVTPELAGRLDRLVRELTGRSWGEVRGMIQAGCVRLDDAEQLDPGATVAAGATVLVRHDPRTKYRERPQVRANSAFRMVFEDEHLIVVDKAARVLTVRTRRGERNTLEEGVTEHVRRGGASRAFVVHRLDRGTSGLLVFAKNQATADLLQDQFRVRKAEREYAAIVAGVLGEDEGTIESRLGTTKGLKQRTVGDDEEGEDAVTHWRVARRLRGATYLRVRLETGRRNQIRVHLAEAGHPVLGDERYNPDHARHPRWKARRLALHAAVLGFEHPHTHAPLRFESPLPAEFERFLESIRSSDDARRESLP
jgi:23S rRNA pseudouridine1911/1915/1917 synthase